MTPVRAATAAFVTLLVVYAATLAPGVTFWDAGEFIAAVHTLGIPHPPGTPLYVMAGHVFERMLPFLSPAVALNLFSAACTAAAGAASALLVSRWLGSGATGLAAALCAGSMSTVWLNATEAEVYSPSLLLACLMLLAADRAGRVTGAAEGEPGDARWLALVAYLLALAVPLHLSALVAAPAAIVLAATPERGAVRRADVVLLAGASTVALGAARASALLVIVGGVVTLAAAALRSPAGVPSRARSALGVGLAVALGLSALGFMLVRAAHDPGVNQGNPATWEALLAVVAREQYAVAGLWPRQAPWWIQLGNLFEWADWQVALGLSPAVVPSWTRTPFTLLFAALGVVGARAHRRADQRTFGAMAVLLTASSVGVAAYLNLKAGPSYGAGVLPEGALHESRERDYFFALAFWAWGLWAGVGAVALVARLAPARRAAGVALAALPILLNWRAVDRRREPNAGLARAFAATFLAQSPPNAVLFVNGDNDSYPVWYLQHVEGVRADVTPVTVPLLGAGWYRAELARRDSLLPLDLVVNWRGVPATIRAISEAAVARGRPVAASVVLTRPQRDAAGSAWTLLGAVYVRQPEPRVARISVDTVAGRALARTLPARLLVPLPPAADGAPAWSQRLLGCAAHTAEGGRTAAVAALLDSTCNRR